MEGLNVRTATEADVPALEPLLQQLFDIEGYDPPAGAIQTAFNKMLSDARNGTIVVAEREGDGIVAMVTVQQIWDFKTGNKVGLLEDNIVRDGFRQQKIGTQMEAFAMQDAASKGLSRVWLVAMDGMTDDTVNTQAVQFYRKHGWQQGDEFAWYGSLPEAEFGKTTFDMDVQAPLSADIRFAEDSDIEELISLAGYGDESRRALAAVLNDPRNGAILIEENDGQILGWATIQYRISTGTGGWAALVENHYVREGHSAANMNDSIARLAKQNDLVSVSTMVEGGGEPEGECWGVPSDPADLERHRKEKIYMRVWSKDTPQE